MRAIDGRYIPIVAPPQHEAQPYYCCKRFYTVILQEVVDAKCQFWTYNFGWAGSCHDWIVFQRSDLRRHKMRNVFLPYKLMLLFQCGLGSIVHSKVLDCQLNKHIGTLFNLVLEWLWKGHLVY
jgi:hypothetical protein